MVKKTQAPKYPCTHPNLRPTSWEQKKPAPAHFVGCSHTYRCPTCGTGAAVWPDPCWQEEMEKVEANQEPLIVRLRGLDKPLIESYLSLPVHDLRSPYYEAWRVQG